MRIFNILESTDDPFQEVDVSDREQIRWQKNREQIAQYRQKKAEKKMSPHIGKLLKTNAKLKPNQVEIFHDGKRYVIDKNHPDRELIQKINARVSRAISATANAQDTDSPRQVARMAKLKRSRWDKGDAVILQAVKEHIQSTQRALQTNNNAVADPAIKYIREYFEYAVKAPWPEVEGYVTRLNNSFTIKQYLDCAYPNKRWPMYEDYMKKRVANETSTNGVIGQDIILYAKNHIRGAWPEMEPTVLKHSYGIGYVYDYCKLRNGPWPEFEALMLKLVPKEEYPNVTLFDYTKKFRNGFWSQFEDAVLATDQLAWVDAYASTITQGRWKEGEAAMMRVIAKPTDPSKGHLTSFARFTTYTKRNNINWPASVIEKLERNMPAENMLQFAINVMDKRWPAAELKMQYYAKNFNQNMSYVAKEYATQFLGGVWKL